MLMLMLLLLILDAAFRLEMSLKAYLAAALVGFMISLMIDGLVSGHHGLQVRPRRSAAASVQELSLLLICALVVTSLVPGARTDAGAGSDSVKAPCAVRRWLVECVDGSSHAVSSIHEMPDIMASHQTECIIKPLLATIHAGFHSPPAAALPLHDSSSPSAYYGSTAELAAEVTESAPLSPRGVAARGPSLSGELQGSAKVHAHETNGQTATRGEDKAEPSEVGQTASQPGDGALTHSPGVGPAIEADVTIGNCACADRSARKLGESSLSSTSFFFKRKQYRVAPLPSAYPKPLPRTYSLSFCVPPHHRPHRRPMQHACGLHDQHEVHVVHDARRDATHPRSG